MPCACCLCIDVKAFMWQSRAQTFRLHNLHGLQLLCDWTIATLMLQVKVGMEKGEHSW